MSAETHSRLEAVKALADKIDQSLENAGAELAIVRHDQRSLRTAILALQSELEAEDRDRAGSTA